MQHRSWRQTELFTHATRYLPPAYLYQRPFFAFRLPLFYSFNEPIVSQVTLVDDLV